MRLLAINAVVSALIVAGALLAYDRMVVRPAQTIGIVDVAQIYALKEAEFSQRLNRSGSDEDRQQAMLLARDFSRRFPAALEELPRDCNCLVVIKAAVVGQTGRTVDLTNHLKAKLEAK
jgi:hypothetical protein